MQRTQYYVAASVDGFIADKNDGLDWLFPFDKSEGVADHYARFFADVGALAMGASTYEFMRRHDPVKWPYMSHPSWIFTHRTLDRYEGADLRFSDEDVAAAHAEMLRAAKGKNVWIVGGGRLVAQFVERGLLDELRLTVIPVVLGSGAPLLPAAVSKPMTLTQIDRLGDGVTSLTYALAKK